MALSSSDPFSVAVLEPSALAQGAAALGPGEWADSIAMPPDTQEWDISWQNRTGFYDEARREIQYMGKPQASAGGENRSTHHVYDEDSDAWRTVSSVVTPSALGHIWCVTFDHDKGDYYHLQQQPNQGDFDNTRTLLRYDREADSWGQLPQADFDVWNNSSTPNSGPVFHPNLLGPGRPGIYCSGNDVLSYFDVSAQTWTMVVGDILYHPTYGGDGSGGWRHNSSLYVPGLDLALFGSGERGYIGGEPHCLIIEAGGADNPEPPVRSLPVAVDNLASGVSANMLLDPTDPSRSTIMLLERGGNRVWTSDDPRSGAQSWTLQPYTHPLWTDNPYRIGDSDHAGSWTCCSLPRYGVVLGMGTQNGGGTVMWRPG